VNLLSRLSRARETTLVGLMCLSYHLMLIGGVAATVMP
jgi:hypothetical protein